MHVQREQLTSANQRRSYFFRLWLRRNGGRDKLFPQLKNSPLFRWLFGVHGKVSTFKKSPKQQTRKKADILGKCCNNEVGKDFLLSWIMKTHLTTAEVIGMPGSNINETSCLAQCSIEQELLCMCCAWGSLRHKLRERLLSLLACVFPWRADEMIAFNPLSVWCGGGCYPSKAKMEVICLKH